MSALEITECISKPSSVSGGKEGDIESEDYAKEPALLWLPDFWNKITLLAVVSCANNVHFQHGGNTSSHGILVSGALPIQLFIIWSVLLIPRSQGVDGVSPKQNKNNYYPYTQGNKQENKNLSDHINGLPVFSLGENFLK